MAFPDRPPRPFASTSSPSDGSRTITALGSQTSSQAILDANPVEPAALLVGTLRLHGGRRPSRQHVAWDENVVDNEGCGRKSSKICCIYHRPKRFDESSDEDSSDSGSDSSCDEARHSHSRSREQRPAADGNEQGEGVIRELKDGVEANAYEISPVSKKGKRKAKGQ